MKNWKDLANDAALAIALVVALGAEVVVVIVEGTNNVASTSLPAVILVLGGALAGTKIPKP